MPCASNSKAKEVNNIGAEEADDFGACNITSTRSTVKSYSIFCSSFTILTAIITIIFKRVNLCLVVNKLFLQWGGHKEGIEIGCGIEELCFHQDPRILFSSDADPVELLYGSGSGNPPYKSGSGPGSRIRIQIQGKNLLTEFNFSKFCGKKHSFLLI